MRIFLTILFFVCAINVFAQDKVIVKYYDSIGWPTTKEHAKIYSEFQSRDSFYNCTSYYVSSKKIYSKFVSLDSDYRSCIGLVREYFENGNLKDSSLYISRGKQVFDYTFYESGKRKESTRFGNEWGQFVTDAYYESGKLWAHFYKNGMDQKTKCEAFDEDGKSIPNYIYSKAAEFPGGLSGWQKFLVRNLNVDLPIKNGAPPGKYTVYVTFIVDKEGNINDVKAENNPGYGTMHEAIRVIEKGPKWEAAIQYNKPVIYRHKQGITFVVSN